MKGRASIFLIFGLIAFGLGFYMLFIDKEMLGGETMNPTIRTVFALLLLLYGGFRIVTGIGGIRKGDKAA